MGPEKKEPPFSEELREEVSKKLKAIAEDQEVLRRAEEFQREVSHLSPEDLLRKIGE